MGNINGEVVFKRHAVLTMSLAGLLGILENLL
jgi:hypothetical protein